jgi:hypothetical protein
VTSPERAQTAYRLHVGRLARFLTSAVGAEAVTLGRRIFLSRSAAREILSDSDAGRRLLRHEAAHVAQFARDGCATFLWRYAFAYARGRKAGLSHAAAYEEIPAEHEARAAETELYPGRIPVSPSLSSSSQSFPS